MFREKDCNGCDGGEVSGIKLDFATMFRAKLSGITSSVFVNEMLPPGQRKPKILLFTNPVSHYFPAKLV